MPIPKNVIATDVIGMSIPPTDLSASNQSGVVP